MADVEVIRDATGETMMVAVNGLTESGIEFIDSYMGDEIFVVDSGRIVIRESDLDALHERAAESGVSINPPEDS